MQTIEIEHTRNNIVCTSLDLLVCDTVWDIIYELKRCIFTRVVKGMGVSTVVIVTK